LIVVLGMFGLVAGFTFPADWENVRKTMMERKRQEKETLQTRFFGPVEDYYEGYGDPLPEDEDDDDENKKTIKQDIVIDPIMLEVMRIANFTELDLQFENGLQVRNAFGVLEEEVKPIPFRGSDAVWNLTRSLIRENMYQGSTGNSLFSPISILTTLNMIFLGTSGTIHKEIRETFGYPRYTGLVHSQFQEIIRSMNEDIGVQVNTLNAIFSQVNFPLSARYKRDLEQYYGSQVHIIPLDFTSRPMTTMRIMNRFISSKTNGLIENMFTEPVAEDSKLVLSNALYFKGTWEYEFLFAPPYDVGIDIEFESFKRNISLTLMTALVDFPFLSDPDLGFEIASLPYEHDIRNEEISEAHMFMIRPNHPGEQNFIQLEQKLAQLDWEDVFSRMEPIYGEIQMPRMKLEFQTNLAPILSKLGLKKLFSGRGSSDFAPLTPKWNEFKVDTLQHKTVLKVTEKGTEAAAATSAFQFRMMPSKVFQLDRPFFLFIYDALNKVVIFWARVVEPEPIHLRLQN